MADLKPLGSEKLQGYDKINRILEIARYNEPVTKNNDNNNTDYTVELADGHTYGIVHEKLGYVIKRSLNESEFDYIEPMKNRKHYRSYSQAMKKLNLMAGELNRIYENHSGIELLGEKKYTLKTPKPSVDSSESAPPPAPAPAPPPAPAPTADASMDMGTDMGGDMGADMGGDMGADMGGDMGADMGGDMGADMGGDMGADMGGDQKDGEETSFKSVQKLTGKLGQKLRKLNELENLSSENIKYILNSILSAINLDLLSDEDKEDILSNFEEEEIDYGIEDDLGVGDNAAMDLDLDSSGEDVGDTEELQEYDIYGNDEFGYNRFSDEESIDLRDLDKYDFDAHPPVSYRDFKSMTGRYDENDPENDFNERVFNFNREKYGSPRLGTLKKDSFMESKTEKILKKYFTYTNEEKVLLEEKRINNFLNDKIKKVNQKKRVVELSETFEQESTAGFLLSESKNAQFIGKTNKGNLVFEINNIEFKITKSGELI
jgi:hypothetical protein